MILSEYHDTVFKAAEPKGGWPPFFHVITAWNPGVFLSFEENNAADRNLHDRLNTKGVIFRVIGCSPDMKHQEPGWGVYGLTQADALEIGREYRQNAIFEISEDLISVIGCITGEVQFVGLWSDRLR